MSSADRNNILSVDYFADLNSDIVKAPETIYLSEVNIPTRSFLQGFTNSNGALLQDDKGQTLVEYFALKMESILKLGPNDSAGYYELATVSDDGTVLQIKENNTWNTIVSNDGAHSTRMGCMNRSIYLDQDSRVPIRIFYNQGPREMIANVLIWNYRGKDPMTSQGARADP